MSIACEIRFDENRYGVYFPGQTISGTVELRLAEATKVRGVALQISGTAQVLWSETHGGGKTQITIVYSGVQKYLRTKKYLAEPKMGDTLELLPGIHTYSFATVLPTDLVTSVEAEHGHVRYTAKVVLERPWKIDLSYKVAFTVLRHVNLNDEQLNVRLPASEEKNKVFCCGPCSSNPMHMTAEIPITGYVPGQTVMVKIGVNNASKKNLTEISTKLVRINTFTSQSPFKHAKQSSKVMAEVRCAGVSKQSEACYEQLLLIPSLAPTSNGCSILVVNYAIHVEGKVPGMTINPKIQIPITLGTIPLSANAIPRFGADFGRIIVTQPGSSGGGDPGLANFPADLPPPSYEEAVNADHTNIQDEGETNEIGWKDYSPRYMVYRFSDVPLAPEPTAPQATGSQVAPGPSGSSTGMEKY